MSPSPDPREPILRELGRLVVAGGEMEYQLTVVVAWLASGDDGDLGPAMNLTAGMSVSQLADKLGELSRIRGATDELLRQIGDVAGRVKNAWTDRNRFVHSLWFQRWSPDGQFRRHRVHRGTPLGFRVENGESTPDEIASVTTRLQDGYQDLARLHHTMIEAGLFGTMWRGDATDLEPEQA